MKRKNRTAKIHYKSVPRDTYYKKVPWLNLSGVWLEKIGFDVGDNITIVVQNKSLVISVSQKAPKADPYRL
ncbi:toxic protein SymE [Chitinophaga terrae (ex Kim and Jung 2007)]|uniref:SymE family type I addiction module toxin n=1 Tax=Chitinophaga terrae (ex Kim and Jung 2007) TaxID=408074 RepID=UPI002787B482|nr:SymE family type I addiction module toxin [Chitinophaga terrae (ex Kim and Jung 2007)]MDQ0108948.1 toxic protein SymE [Chitinophaga terrae (ex Kim and Jung 2007)]